MRIAIDATYSVDPTPSGIAIYSQEMLAELAGEHPEDLFLHCFRPKQFGKATAIASKNCRKRLLLPPLPTFRADLFHALNQRVDLRAARRVVSTFHDLFVMTAEYSSAEFRQRFTRQAKMAAQHSDLIIAVSEFTAKQVHELLGVERSRIRTIPHGTRTVTSPSGAAKEQVVLFVGAIQTRKNVARLVRAFESLPADWRLVLAGSTRGFGSEAILRQIEMSEARERIAVLGYLSTSELNEQYARASIFAFPSLDEGFGMPVLEAMARGVPVLTSNCSALPEVAERAAVLVDPYHEEAIKEGLLSLVRDVERRTELSRLGLERTRLFSWERAAKATYEVYKEMTYL